MLRTGLAKLARVLGLGWTYRLARWVLGGVFIVAGGLKLANPQAFAGLISHYNLVPEALLPYVALGLPGLEVLAGLGLLFDLPGALSTLTAMLLLFAGVLWFGILKDLDIDCGCFSPTEQAGHQSLYNALFRDLGFLTLALYLYAYRWLCSPKQGKELTCAS